MKKVLLLALLCAQYVLAAETGGSENIEGCEVAQVLTIENFRLEKIGAGVRVKRAYLMNWPVYVAALYCDNKKEFARNSEDNKALESMLKMPAFAIQLQLLRDVPANDMVTSFEQALKANNAQDSQTLNNFKEMLRARETLAYGESVTVMFINEPDNKRIICDQNGKDKVEIPGDDQAFKDILSIWLGIPVDDHMKTLRTKIIEG